MNPFIRFKNAIPLIVIAGVTISASSVATATVPEQINPDIGFDVLTSPRAAVADFNNDGHPDYVLITRALVRQRYGI